MTQFINGFRVIPTQHGILVVDISCNFVNEEDLINTLSFTSYDDFQDWCADWSSNMEGRGGMASQINGDES